jgi:hypothetical protein
MQKLEINSLPKTLVEARAAGHNLYYTGKPCKHGHDTYRYVAGRICSACAKLKTKIASTVGGGNARRWAAKTVEQKAIINKKRMEYYGRTKELRLLEKKRWYENTKAIPGWLEQRRLKVNAYRAKAGRPKELSNPDVKYRYKQSEKGKVSTRANDAKRRAAKLQRTPAWLTEEDFWMIEQAYELAAMRTKLFGFSWHVDHVMPLQGAVVSGLHVPTNLQVISGVLNIAKANKYLPA